jgi:hypothetical protein
MPPRNAQVQPLPIGLNQVEPTTRFRAIAPGDHTPSASRSL